MRTSRKLQLFVIAILFSFICTELFASSAALKTFRSDIKRTTRCESVLSGETGIPLSILNCVAEHHNDITNDSFSIDMQCKLPDEEIRLPGTHTTPVLTADVRIPEISKYLRSVIAIQTVK